VYPPQLHYKYQAPMRCFEVQIDCEQLLALVYDTKTTGRDAIVQGRIGNYRNAGGKDVWNNLNSLYLKGNRTNVTDM
jgi:hypothetical protein